MATKLKGQFYVHSTKNLYSQMQQKNLAKKILKGKFEKISKNN